MICNFPDPYPGELLYSVCARYSAWMKYPNSVTGTRDFFGDRCTAAVVDLPNRIDHLIAALPPGHLYSVNEFIYQHTHFPFYAPFLPPERATLMRNSMQEGGQNRVAERIGLSADRLKMPTFLRFCPSCVEYDKANVGETYWHRIHQIPGVEVCPHHAVFLEESNILWRNTRNPGETFPAEQAVLDSPVRVIDTSTHSHSIQLSIARYAQLLLESPRESIGGKTLRFRYHNLLLRQGLAYYNGQVRTGQLIQKLSDYYPGELLSRLGCEIKNSCSNWLLRLLHTHKAGVAQHPIRHILFLILIDCSVRDLFDSFIEFKPFGEGPWPCLNYASDHYKESRVNSCRINDGEKKNKGKPVGTFSCSCGYVYTRTGPDRLEDDRFMRTSVLSYGRDWENKLKKLWNDTSVTLRQVAQELGVNELTVKRRAIGFGLAFPRPTPGSLRASGEVLDRYKIKRKSLVEIRDQKRKAFLSLIKDNPQAGRAELKAQAPQLMVWLTRWDEEWLDTFMPPIKKKQPPKATINWEEHDPALSKAIKEATFRIRSWAYP